MSGMDAIITYQGGDGNDVVITLTEITLSVAPLSVLEDDPDMLDFTFTRTGDTGASITID